MFYYEWEKFLFDVESLSLNWSLFYYYLSLFGEMFESLFYSVLVLHPQIRLFFLGSLRKFMFFELDLFEGCFDKTETLSNDSSFFKLVMPAMLREFD